MKRNVIMGSVLIIILVIGIPMLFTKKEENNFKSVKEQLDGVFLNGDYITYINIGDEYEELGAKAYDSKGIDVSKKIVTSYFNGSKQVYIINSDSVNSYKVKYQVVTDSGTLSATRIVIVSDKIAPKFGKMDTVTIKISEVSTFDTKSGVTATDNSGKVTINCDNTLKEAPGKYIITCKAKDVYGNESVKKRIIKVEY